MGQNRQMGEHLVIDELVLLRRLYHLVQGQHPSEGLVLEDDETLVIGLAVVVDGVGSETQLEVVVQLLDPPAAHTPRPRRCSSTTMRDGLKRSRSTSTAFSGLASPHMKMSSAA